MKGTLQARDLYIFLFKQMCKVCKKKDEMKGSLWCMMNEKINYIHKFKKMFQVSMKIN